MNGKNVVVTGGNDGIGYFTCLQLAQKGAQVIMICRNEQKAKECVKRITAITSNKCVDYIIADLSSQEQVRRAAYEVKTKLTHIDVLINNAASVFQQFELSENGYEMTIATNHLAAFLLTGQLLHLLKEEARIINISSHSHYRGSIDVESFSAEKNYSLMKAYEQSKLANVLFTVELAEQLKNSSISVACLHPGKVKTRLGRKALGSNFFSKLVITAMQWFTFLFGISANKAAKAVVMLALSHEVKNISGKYFSKGKILSPHALVNDVYIRKKLWVVSEQYTKEYYNYNIGY